MDKERRFGGPRAALVSYWVATVLVTAELLLGGAWDVLQVTWVRAIIDHLGYPRYVLVILGSWKLLGAAALLAPRFPRLKEWAYAGAVFNYTGAIASHLAVGDGPLAILYPIIQLGLLGASWSLRPSSRRDRRPAAA